MKLFKCLYQCNQWDTLWQIRFVILPFIAVVGTLVYRKRSLLFASFILFFIPESLYSQQIISPPDHIYNAFVHQDQAGFIWISSLNGWYQYDGKNFTAYPILDNHGASYPDQNIQSNLFCENQGHCWFSTYTALHALSLETGQSLKFQFAYHADTIRDNYQVLYLDSLNQTLWVQASKKIWLFDLSTFTYTPLPYTFTAKRFAFTFFPDGTIKSIIGCPWKTKDGFELLDRKKPDEAWHFQTFYDSEKFDYPEITGAVFTSPNQVYFSTRNGLAAFDIDRRFFSYPQTKNKQQVWSYPSYSIAYDSISKHLYLSGKEIGLAILNCDVSGKIDSNTLTIDSGYKGCVSLNLTETPALWVTLPQKGLLHQKIPQPNTPFYSQLPQFRQILSLQKSVDGKLFLYDKPSGIWHLKKDTSWQCLIPLDTSDTYIGFTTTATNLLLYTRNQVDFFDRSTYRLQHTYHLDKDQKLINIVSHESGDIALMTRRRIIFLRKMGQQLIPYHTPVLDSFQSFNFDRHTYLNDGAYLAAYNSTELWQFDWQSTDLRLINKRWIGADILSCAANQNGGGFWLGTTQGLHFVKKDSIQLISHIMPNGRQFHPNVITSYGDQLLLGTTNELIWYNPNTQKSIIYESIEKNTKALVIDLHGRCWGVFDQQLYWFYPDSLTITQEKFQPYLRQIWINNAPLDTEKNLSDIATLDLNYRENSLKFEVGSIYFGERDRIQLLAQLAPFDTTWVALQDQGIVRFPKAPPGEYKFNVAAIDKHGNRHDAISLPINITPPFWQQLWFQSLMLFSIAGLLYLSHRVIIRQKMKQAQIELDKQRQITLERDRIASEVHDDLGGQLSSILYLSEEVLLEDEQLAANLPQINRIHDLSKTSLQNIREIIFALDTRKSTLSDLLDMIENYGKTLFEDHKIAFTVRKNLVQSDWMLDSRQKRNLNLIAKEAFHNITKHAKANWVGFNVNQTQSNLHLIISDDGRGFQSSDSSSSGYGLENMQRKAKEIGAELSISSDTNGTTISLEWLFLKTTKS